MEVCLFVDEFVCLFVDESRHIGRSRAEFTPEGIEKILDSGKA